MATLYYGDNLDMLRLHDSYGRRLKSNSGSSRCESAQTSSSAAEDQSGLTSVATEKGIALVHLIGEPTTPNEAALLAEEDKFRFQWWALGLVGARLVERKKGADHGIDGQILFRDDAAAVEEERGRLADDLQSERLARNGQGNQLASCAERADLPGHVSLLAKTRAAFDPPTR